MSIESYIRAVPKADLHVHLEGAIQPDTLRRIAAENGIDLPAELAHETGGTFTYRDFEHFRLAIRTCARCLVSGDDYELAVYEFGRDMARQHVRYAEVRFGPTTPYFRGISQQTYMDGLTRGRARALQDFGVMINWVFELGRGPDQNPEAWDYTTQVAIEGKEAGVVALGLAGPEYRHPTDLFAPWFDRARAAGLHSAPHAGELAGPESMWAALRALGAERLGHGVRAVEDPALVRLLVDTGVPLEVCPRSNVCLGVYGNEAEHPFAELYHDGVTVTVNSDDPALFGTTLTDELVWAAEHGTLRPEAIDELLLNGIRCSFLADGLKERHEIEFRGELDELKQHSSRGFLRLDDSL